jgi:hypothetical protein
MRRTRQAAKKVLAEHRPMGHKKPKKMNRPKMGTLGAVAIAGGAVPSGTVTGAWRIVSKKLASTQPPLDGRKNAI